MGENNEKMLRVTTKQFSQFSMPNREKETFFPQLETNPKGETSSALVHDNLRKVNATITLRSE